MPKYSYPGVYVNEIPSGDRSVSGVSTAVAAFVGFTAKGKLNEATRILNWGDFEKQFGGLNANSDVSYAVRQYFLNGGSEAYVVRTATGAKAASVMLKATSNSGANVLQIQAISEGVWGNNLRVSVDYATSNPDSLFNLVVGEYREGASSPVAQEVFRNLSMNPESATYAPAVINQTSNLIRATSQNKEATAAKGYSLSGSLTETVKIEQTARYIRVAINGEGPYEIAVAPTPPDEGTNMTLADIASQIQKNLKAASSSEAFNAEVKVEGGRIKITSGKAGAESAVVVTPAGTADASKLLKLGLTAGGREFEAAGMVARPAQNGTTSDSLDYAAIKVTLANQSTRITVKSGDLKLFEKFFTLSEDQVGDTLAKLAENLQAKIRGLDAKNPVLKGLTVRVIGTQLAVLPSAESGDVKVTFTDMDDPSTEAAEAVPGLADKLGLDYDENVAWYQLGATTAIAAQGAGEFGANGTPADSSKTLLGSLAEKTGMYALENADLFTLLAIPEMARLKGTEHSEVMAVGMKYCEDRRAFFLVDAPASITTPEAMANWMRETAPRHKNAAVYFPQVMIADPLNGGRLRPMAPSGTVAGVYARTDSTRGIWKVPAGVDATMSGVQALAYNLTDAENGILNELGCNCLRNFPVYGKVIWGARTLTGADEMVSEWKYVAVRRLSLYIEESLFRGTKWSVFEPNAEQLWSQIRLSVGTFMNQLYRQGAFPGAPKDAYFVQCDSGTTTAADVNQGVVNIMVGFAPLKPAEFVVLNLQQIASKG